ncbi:MAG TPA: multidrug ABC transporter substrate-binding protein [Gammaproteobacteria bacterium]|nr:multidrug ABC transporter substrate-binding protein [Gammaproteobacteria bacterium]
MFFALFESSRSALISIYAHGMRSFLTTLGIVIGVASVIAVISVTEGMSAFIGDTFATLGSNSLTIQSYTPFEDQMKGIRARLTPEDMELIEMRTDGIASITPILFATRSSQIKFGSQTAFSQIMGTTYAYQDVSQSYISVGRFLAPSDNATRRRIAVIGEKVRENLNLPENPLNEYVELGGEWFKIVGLMEPKGEIMGFSQDDIVLVPYSTMRSLQGNQTRTDIQIQLSLSDTADVEIVTQQLTTLLRNAHDLNSDEDDDFVIQTAEQLMETFDTIINMVTIVIGGIVSISLLVGGIGIMNIMLVSVTERTREIGIRLDIGAVAREVLMQFLVEAIVLSCLGGLIGLLLALIASLAIAPLMQVPFLFDVKVNLIAFLFSAAIGVVFGYFPARRAAALNPIDALRHE